MNGTAYSHRNGVHLVDSFAEGSTDMPRPRGPIRAALVDTIDAVLADYAIDYPSVWWARRPYRIDVTACPTGARGEWRWTVRPRV